MLNRIRFSADFGRRDFSVSDVSAGGFRRGKHGGGGSGGGGMSRSVARSSFSNNSIKSFSPSKSMSLRPSSNLLSNKVGKVSSSNLSSNVLKTQS